MNPASSQLSLPKDAGSPPGAWPWIPDLGNGSYRNPVICADYSDPDVVRHGDEFYMTASSFNCTPGLPILHSRDLVNWRLIGHAVKNLPDERYQTVQPGCGVWAPALRVYEGRFWIFFPTPDEGIYMTTATDPAGPWSKPHLVQAGKGLIDPCPLWDDDGQAYLVHAYAGSRAGIKHRLRVCPMAPDGSRLLGEGEIVFHDPERHPTLEGPKFLKRGGWYYILAPAGGVATGWQVVLRSRSIYGPYDDRVVLEQGSTPINGPHQGALVDTPEGEWWFIHFQDNGVYGRIVHLQPVEWRDEWPLMGRAVDGNGTCEPVLRHSKPKTKGADRIITPQTSDEFDAPSLGLQWQWNANHRDDWFSLKDHPGWLRLFARACPEDLATAPHLLGQKFPAREFTAETCVQLGTQPNSIEAGLTVMGLEHAAIAIACQGSTCLIRFRVNHELSELALNTPRSARFRVQVVDGGECRFAYAIGEADFVEAPGRFRAREGQWIGARIMLYAMALADADQGYADFDYLRFGPPE